MYEDGNINVKQFQNYLLHAIRFLGQGIAHLSGICHYKTNFISTIENKANKTCCSSQVKKEKKIGITSFL